MKLTPTAQANFPSCPLCYGSIRRPCTLARNEPEPYSQVVCSVCYRLVQTLHRLQQFGWIT